MIIQTILYSLRPRATIHITCSEVGYVQGQGGMVLRSIEEEWGTLMEPRRNALGE